MQSNYVALIFFLILSIAAQCQENAEDWINRGNTLYSQNNYDEAIQAFDEAIKLNPNSAIAWSNKANVLISLNRSDESLQASQKAIELDPNLVTAWNNKGRALSILGNFDKAIYALDEAIRIDSNYALAWNNKGIAFAKQGEFDEAIICFNEVIKLNPDNALTAMAWNNKGQALSEQGKFDESLAFFDEAIRIDPSFALARINKDKALEALGNSAEANEIYAKAGQREVQASDILAKIRKREPIEYSHIIVQGDIDLGKLDLPVKQVSISPFETQYQFAGKMRIIESPIRINDSYINGSVDFREVIFNNAIDFSGSNFAKKANFGGSIFNDTANFQNAIFISEADFAKSIFRAYATFFNAMFKAQVYFWRAEFNDYAHFGNAAFDRIANFEKAKFFGYAAFYDTTFKLTAIFSEANFMDIANFRASKFYKHEYFTDVLFNKNAYFLNAIFEQDASFSNSEIRESASFENTFFKGKLFLTKTNYNRLYIRWQNIKDSLVYEDSAYMSLMKNFRDLGYLEDCDSCYFQYRKEHRAQPWPTVNDWEERARKLIDYPLEWFYGYGTKPFNALIISIIIILIFGIFWRVFGLGGGKDITKATLPAGEEWLNGGIADILGFSVTVFLSGTRFFIDPPALPKIEGRSRSLIKKAFTLERLLGALFSILFFIAIGGTIVRTG